MDAHDIFRKLTRGLQFPRRLLRAQDSVTKVLSQKEPEIKKENDKPDEPVYSEEEPDNSDAASRSSGEEEGEGEEFQLMDGVKVGKKKRKRKEDKPETLKQKLEVEEHNRFRNEHGIRVVGRAVAPALQDFDSIATRYNVSNDLVNTVKRCGYTEPTPIQRQAVPCMLENRQILACAPTGSGKTAAFLIPVLHTLGSGQGGPRALLLCPTRELAKQTYREALRLSAGTTLRCSVLNKIIESKIKERESTFRKSDIVITTPNRLCYLLNQDSVKVSLERVRWLIVDEADKLFEGSAEQESDFRQQMEQVMVACSSRERRVAMFSATHTPAVAKWCRRNLRGLVNITVGQRNAATQLVEQELLFCGNESGKLVAFRQLVQQGLKPPVLVFVQSKDRAKQLFKELIYDGINVDVIHADRTQAQRDNVVRSFRVGKIWVLICTELMGRGIDFRGVSLVINYDFPPSAIAYVHRIGRAGRAGQRGRAVTFFTQDDVNNLRSIAAVMKQSGCNVPEYMLQLKQNQNIRKKLAKKAPRRDNITTILDSNRKRKLDAETRKEQRKSEKTEPRDNSTTVVKNAKKSKLRRVNGDLPKNKENKDFTKKVKPAKKKLGKKKKEAQKLDKNKSKKDKFKTKKKC